MSAVMQSHVQGHASFPYDPISDVTRMTSVPVLPKPNPILPVAPAPQQQAQQSRSVSMTAASSPSTFPEESASPTSPMSMSPPANPPSDRNNSQLPRPVVLPPRAKPGRKPATDTPASKRKAQNREAQRSFRDRKRQREHEVQEQVRQRERAHLEYIQKMQQKHDEEVRRIRGQTLAAREQERLKIETRLNEQSTALKLQQRRNDELNARVQELIWRQSSGAQETTSLAQRDAKDQSKESREELASFEPNARSKSTAPKRRPRRKSSSIVNAVAAQPPQPTPMDEASDEPMEMDFTNLGKPSQSTLPSFTSLDTTDDDCGFCDTNTYCACRDRMEDPSGAPPQPERIDSYIKLPKFIEPSAAPVGPGGCQACLDDPERRRICLAMASRRQDAQTAAANKPSQVSQSAFTNDTAQPAPSPTKGANPPTAGWQQSHMTCSDAITYGQTHDPNFHENWNRPEFIDRLRIVKPPENVEGDGPASGVSPDRNSSPQDVEIASIMAAMSASGDAGAAARRRERLAAGGRAVLKRERTDS